MKSIGMFQLIHHASRTLKHNTLLTGLCLGIAFSAPAGAEPAPPAQAVCAPQQQACQFTLHDQRPLRVEFNGSPSALHPFKLWVTVKGAHSITAQFTMPDMDMGENRYQLQPLTGQKWQASVILPACMMGGHRWLMTLKVDHEVIHIPFAN